MIQEKEKMGQNVSYAMNVLGIVQKKHYKRSGKALLFMFYQNKFILTLDFH
jgi:hypothetical protein